MSTKRHATIPRVTSKTITVRSLLKKIQRLILDEPKRLNMNDWVVVFAGVRESGVSVASRPACGTVACMAGWGAILLRPDRASGPKLNDNASDVIGNLVGVNRHGGDRRYVGGLFSSGYEEDYDDVPDVDWPCFPEAGTPEHADAVAKRIDNYMKRYPEILTRKIDVAAARKALRA